MENLNNRDKIRLTAILNFKLSKKVEFYNTFCYLNLLGLNENNKLQFDSLHNYWILNNNVHYFSNAECLQMLDDFFTKNAENLYIVDGIYNIQPSIKITLDCDKNGYGYYFDYQDEFCTNNIFYVKKSDDITEKFLFDIGNLLAFNLNVRLDTNIY